MPHVPHLLIPGEWTSGTIRVSDEQRHHVARVLRIRPGAPVSYTDGAGLRGSGTWDGDGIKRGVEDVEPAPIPAVTLAVAPPASRDRVRFLVEKATELGVVRLRWLRTERVEGRIPRLDKAAAWMSGAVEQSRRAWLMRVDDDWTSLSDLDDWVAADVGGGTPAVGAAVTVAVGPEGGWAEGEVPDTVERVSFGAGVLRSETAALVAAAWAGALRTG